MRGFDSDRNKKASFILSEAQIKDIKVMLGIDPVESEDYECKHKWVRWRTYAQRAWSEVVVRSKWMDIPNGEDGDYLMVDGEGPEIMMDEENPVIDEYIICQLCNVRIEDGMKVSP